MCRKTGCMPPGQADEDVAGSPWGNGCPCWRGSRPHASPRLSPRARSSGLDRVETLTEHRCLGQNDGSRDHPLPPDLTRRFDIFPWGHPAFRPCPRFSVIPASIPGRPRPQRYLVDEAGSFSFFPEPGESSLLEVVQQSSHPDLFFLRSRWGTGQNLTTLKPCG